VVALAQRRRARHPRPGLGPHPEATLLDLETALEEYEDDRRFQEQMDPSSVELRPVADSPWIYFACDGPADEPVPINVGSHGVETKVALPSIGELVVRWIELIQSGVFTIGEDGHWENTPIERVPDWAGRLGIH
jgi:hypothetical protein